MDHRIGTGWRAKVDCCLGFARIHINTVSCWSVPFVFSNPSGHSYLGKANFNHVTALPFAERRLTRSHIFPRGNNFHTSQFLISSRKDKDRNPNLPSCPGAYSLKHATINACRVPSRRYRSLDSLEMVVGLHYLCSTSKMHRSMVS